MLSDVLFSKSVSQYVSFGATFFATLHVGSLYMFSAYETQLRADLPTTHISMIGAIGDAGFFSSILIAFFAEEWGTPSALTLSTSFLAGGYMSIYMIKSFAWFAFCFFLLGLGAGGVSVVIITVLTQNFRTRRGVVSGLIVGGFSISAVIWTLAFQYSTVQTFFLGIGISAQAVGLLALLFIDLKPHTMVSSNNNDEYDIAIHHDSTIVKFLREDDYCSVDISRWELLSEPLFWLLFTLELFTYGSCFMWKNNLGLFGVPVSQLPVIVIVFVICHALASVTLGFVSDRLVHRVSRTSWLMAGVTLVMAGMLVFAFLPSLTTIWITTVIVGFGFGITECSLNQVTLLSFGCTHYPFNNSIIHLGGGIGSLVLTAIVDLMVHADPSPMCTSGLPLSCYARPILLAALLTSMSLFCAVYIHFSYPPPWLIPVEYGAESVEAEKEVLTTRRLQRYMDHM